MLTASAFLHFAQEKCDYVSLEVGLGGKNDTTNIVTPEVSVITSIGLDHTDILGNSREKIAREKAEIIKQLVPVVIGKGAADIEYIKEFAKKMEAKIYEISQNFDDF